MTLRFANKKALSSASEHRFAGRGEFLERVFFLMFFSRYLQLCRQSTLASVCGSNRLVTSRDLLNMMMSIASYSVEQAFQYAKSVCFHQSNLETIIDSLLQLRYCGSISLDLLLPWRCGHPTDNNETDVGAGTAVLPYVIVNKLVGSVAEIVLRRELDQVIL